MRSDDFQIRLNGFLPTGTTNKLIQEFAEIITDLSPSDSYIQLNLSKTKKIFQGHLQIMTSGNKYSFFSKENSPDKILTSLNSSFMNKIKKWKKMRFVAEQNLGGTYV